MTKEKVSQWYANKLNKTVEEFDEYDLYCALIAYTFFEENCNNSLLKDVKRLCDIILNNKTNVGEEAESLALHIGHHSNVLNL